MKNLINENETQAAQSARSEKKVWVSPVLVEETISETQGGVNSGGHESNYHS